MTVDVSKQVAYALLVGDSVDVSKQVAYAVLRNEQINVSKQVAYALLLTANSVNISKQVCYAVLFREATGNLQLPFIGAEPVTDGNPNVRLPSVSAQPITGGNPNVRLPSISAQPITGGNPNVRCPLIGIEVFYALPEEIPVATDVLPTRQAFQAPETVVPLPGLGWSVHKKPNFRTQINSSVAGAEDRTSRMQYPLWEFELTFEYLDNRLAKTQMDQLQGFFLNQRGSWGSWLFQDWTDYLLTNQFIGVADGGTTGFVVTHTIGGFSEPIGQFDLKELFEFAEADVDTMTSSVEVEGHGLSTGFGPIQLTTSGTLPAGLSPLTNYWLIAVDANNLQFALSPADAAAGTEVVITDDGMGTFTASNSVAVYVDGTEVDPNDYVVTNPNYIVFDTAPMSGNISVSCKFFYLCRFLEDVADFEQFMDRLYTLDTLAFQSIVYRGQQS